MSNLFDILNSYYTSTRGSHHHIDREELIIAFPLLRDEEEPIGEVRITTSVHCECTIASHMPKRVLGRETFDRFRPKSIKIGISDFCWFCEKYMKCLQTNSLVRFIVSGYQRKIQAGWTPPSGPQYALNSIAKLVRHEVDEILGTVENKCRSDSFPVGSVAEEMTAYEWANDKPFLASSTYTLAGILEQMTRLDIN